jgi:hypothetical protein
MKKVLLVLVALALIMGFSSCKNDKLGYTLTVSGDVNVLDSAVVTKVYKVFTNETTFTLDKQLEILKDEEVAADIKNYVNSEIPLPEKTLKKLLGIKGDVLSYYIYVIGYVKDTASGLRVDVDRTFSKNWDKPLPDKPKP